ncbi:aminotransferase [Thermoascus aurantiacus ATCC 26904]
MASTFDIAQSRSRFPALQQFQIFMDNAGGSQVLDTVIDSLQAYLSRTNVQLGATYEVARSSNAAYEQAYKAAAKFINASPDEISIGVSTTQLLHNLSTALDFQPGDELILSKLNHEANIAPWVRIAQRLGLTVKWWSSSDRLNPVCDVEELKSLLSEKTRLVTCPHASNITGTITKVKEIADVVHSFPRALICVDGVALAPHRQVDVKALDVDFYAFSWYKVYGPHIAQLYASSRVHSQINSLGHYFKGTETLDLKLNLASANYELAQTIPRIVEYFGSDVAGAWEQIATYEEKLQGIILEYLNSNERITIYGERSARKELRVPVISFTVKGMQSRTLVEEVEKRSPFGFRNGHMYSHRLVKEVLGLEDVDDGVVRVSLLHYNTEDEVRGLIKVLEEVIKN